MNNKQVKMTLMDIFGQYVAGLYNGREAAVAIDSALHGLTGLRYKNASCLSVDDGQDRYSLSVAGLSKKQKKKVENDLVPAMHILRTQHGQGNGTEAHISNSCSTKHYRGNFEYLVNRVSMQYGM
ncbi:hypothetical protein CL615_00300 [archaeon]|nr:hypothetical protein [archaeon]MDP6547427.1 hypothetical protein [Candidatus Woesearchaeota archaeon]